MSTTSHTSPLNQGQKSNKSTLKNSTATSFTDMMEQLEPKVSITYKFSSSSLTNSSKKAKKLKKELGIEHKESLDKVSVKEGFDSFKDFKSQFNYWKTLPITYIYVSKYDSKVYYTKDIYNRLPNDDPSKSMDELLKDSNRDRVDWKNSLSEPNHPLSLLDNHKFGIKLLTEEEKEEFFRSYDNKSTFRYDRIDKKEDFIFKFIHYRLDPKDEEKIIADLKTSSTQFKYKFSKSDIYNRTADLIDKQLQNLLNIETTTFEQKVYEYYSLTPKAYIVNGKYYDTSLIYDPPFDDFSVSKSDY